MKRALGFSSLSELYRYRVLIFTLVTRELKARYRGSSLGFFWTILNPLLLMGVYTLVFKYYIRFSVEAYPVFLLCGILPWTYFSFSLTEGTNSILSGGSLITKSLFPPQVLPTVSVLSNLCHYLLALPVLIAFMILFEIPVRPTILTLPVVVLLQTVLTWGLVLGLAALNVHFRDVQHILGNALLLWFFLCPIIYPADQVPEPLRFVRFLNPIGLAIESYHAIFLYGAAPDPPALLSLFIYAVFAALVGQAVFEHYRETFAELV